MKRFAGQFVAVRRFKRVITAPSSSGSSISIERAPEGSSSGVMPASLA